MHLSAAMPGVDPREPMGIYTKTFANPPTKEQYSFNKKLPLSLPPGDNNNNN